MINGIQVFTGKRPPKNKKKNHPRRILALLFTLEYYEGSHVPESLSAKFR